MQRIRLRGEENVRKRYLIQAAAYNLSLLMRQMLGAGTPCEAVACREAFPQLVRILIAWVTSGTDSLLSTLSARWLHFLLAITRGAWTPEAGTSTGC